MDEQRESFKAYTKDELAVLEAAYANLPPVPVVRCGRGHVTRGKINPSNPKDFHRVTNILPFDQQGARLMSDGTIELNIPKLEMEFSRQGLSGYFDFGNLKQRLLQRGGKEEGKQSVRIALPAAPMSAAVPRAFSLGTGAPVQVPAMPAPMPRMMAVPKLAQAPAPRMMKIEVPASAPGVGSVGVDTPSLWQSMQGAVDWSQVATSSGFAFLGGFVMAIVDEILCALITDERKRKLVRRAVNGVAFLIGLGILIGTLVSAPVAIPTLIATILLGFVSSMLGAVVGKLFCTGVKRLYRWLFPNPGPDDEFPVAEPKQWVIPPVPPHQCGTAGEWFEVGKCVACTENVATCMLVHSEGNAAHMAYCTECLQKGGARIQHLCVCGTPISSVAVLDGFAVCPEQCCLQVGICREVDCKTTATCWREDSRGDQPEVDLQYCKPHMQQHRASNMNPQIRFGDCFLMTEV